MSIAYNRCKKAVIYDENGDLWTPGSVTGANGTFNIIVSVVAGFSIYYYRTVTVENGFIKSIGSVTQA